MKVLYYPLIQHHAINSVQAGDYLTDTLFHGLRSLLGEDLVDGYRMWHVYKDAPKEKANIQSNEEQGTPSPSSKSTNPHPDPKRK